MMKIKKTLVALGILLGAAGGTAWAAGAIGSIVAADGTINGCYQQNNGQLRVVAAGDSCRDSELALSWAQKGPAGPAGPQGPQGAPGAGASTLAIDSLTCTKLLQRGDYSYASFPGTVSAQDRGQLVLACIPKQHRVTFSSAPGVRVLFGLEVEGVGFGGCGGCELRAFEGTATITQGPLDVLDASFSPRAWGGACRGQVGKTCSLQLDGDKVITAE